MQTTVCPECNAQIPEGKICQDYLNSMTTWDFEDFAGVGQIHHLTVVCYNLQHPSLYSQRGLEEAECFLREYMGTNFSYEEHDSHSHQVLACDVPDFKIADAKGERGAYKIVPTWTMTAKDIVESGLSNYVENVKKWSYSIYKCLEHTN